MENSENNKDLYEKAEINQEEQAEKKKREVLTENELKKKVRIMQKNTEFNKECSVCFEDYTEDNLPCNSVSCTDSIICQNCSVQYKECPVCKVEVEKWQENLSLFKNIQQSLIEKSFIQINFKEEGKVSLSDPNPAGDGKGTWTGTDGSKFEGEFKAFKFSNGVYEDKKGLKYDGEFFNGEYNGKGILYIGDELVYEGEWRQNKKDGKGKFKDKNCIYEGEWKNDFRDGEGEQVWTDQMKFKGVWSKNKHVNGTMVYPDKSIYSGSFHKNLFSGKGKLVYSDGSVYEGDWKDGLYNGEGILTTSEIVYKGSFEDGLAEGEGKLQIGQSVFLEGVFKEGVIKRGFYKNQNIEYTGEFEGNSMSGKSVFKIMDGLSQILAIEGNFDKGVLNGEIEMFYKNIKVQAKMTESKLNGVGTVVYPSGQRFEGLFKENCPHEKGLSKFESGASIESEWEEGIKSGIWTFRDKEGNSKQIRFNQKGDEEFVLAETNDFKIQYELAVNGWTRIFFSSGTIYEGELSEGKPHGWGRLTKKDQMYTGNFVSGKYDGHGELLSNQNLEWTLKKKLNTDGIAYFGEFKEGLFEGSGCFMTKTEVYTGEFKKGLKNGIGLFEGEEFDYEGEFVEDSPNGIGKLYNRSKEEISGFWENGGPKDKFLLEFASETFVIEEKNGILTKKGKFIEEKEPSNQINAPMQIESSSKSINSKQSKPDSFPSEDSISEENIQSSEPEEI